MCDNVFVNPAIARKIDLPMSDYVSHKINLAVQFVIDLTRLIVDKVAELIPCLSSTKHHHLLRERDLLMSHKRTHAHWRNWMTWYRATLPSHYSTTELTFQLDTLSFADACALFGHVMYAFLSLLGTS